MNADQIASLTTAGGTLVLAIATFGATRSANRASRLAERSLLTGLRPVLMHAQLQDPAQKIGFVDQHWVHVEGPGAAFEEDGGVVYLAIAMRNVGNGIAVIQGWRPSPRRLTGDAPAPPGDFRPQTRDLYIPAGGLGFWQGAFRDHTDPLHDEFVAAARERQPVTIDLLYTDMHGGQQTITRFAVIPGSEERWVATVSRHWMVDGSGPRG